MIIETKYSVGETVWSVSGHKIESHIINSIKVSVNYHGDKVNNIRYRIKGEGTDTQALQRWVNENHLFPTKEALIASL